MALFFLTGNPPHLIWWFKQCLVYILVMFIEKSTIVLLVQLSFWDDVRKFILTPFKYHPKLEAGFVMLIVPFIMNVSDAEFPLYCQLQLSPNVAGTLKRKYEQYSTLSIKSTEAWTRPLSP